eukprot:8540014-Alexandrium_andersonii.AAC.1
MGVRKTCLLNYVRWAILMLVGHVSTSGRLATFFGTAPLARAVGWLFVSSPLAPTLQLKWIGFWMAWKVLMHCLCFLKSVP